MRTKHKDLAQLRKRATAMRWRGESYPAIEESVGVSRSTLSGWFKGLELPLAAREKILGRKKKHLQTARLKALEVKSVLYQAQRRATALDVRRMFNKLSFDRVHAEALLAMLYLGEGFKKRSLVALGNSDPRILKCFVELLRKIYKVPNEKLRCYLYLRSDHNAVREIRFWSRALGIPSIFFRKPQFDKRTLGKKTWNGYHGVCAVYCYDAAIEKRLTAAQEILLTILGS